jgi:hypothetical protein
MFHPQIVWLSDDFNGSGGITVPLSAGHVASKRRGAVRRNAPYPWAHKLKSMPETSLNTSESNRRSAKSVRRPEEQAASVISGMQPPLFCVRALCSFHGWGQC